MQLNTEQQQVVDHDGHSLVVACPGSGKTRVITTKIGALLKRHSGAKICAVTFTRDAATELKSRVVSEVGEQSFRRCCRVGTFHSLAIKQLRSCGLLGKVASPGEQRGYVRRALALAAPELTLDEATQIIENAKTTFGECEEKQTPVFLAYHELLNRNQVEDLYDVLRRSVEQMRTGALLPIPVQFMLVDEFQDTDHIQLAWVMEHVRAGTRVTVVGDDDQSIYGWRGALGYPGMQEFKKLTDAKHITLAVNYRCHEEILTAADRLITKNSARVEKRLFAARGKGGCIISMRLPSRTSEVESVVQRLLLNAKPVDGPKKGLVHLTLPAGAWAVLCRNRYLLDQLEPELADAGIKYNRSAGESIWNRQPFVFMISLIRSIQTGENDGFDQALSHSLAIKIGHMAANTCLKTLHSIANDKLFELMRDGHPIDRGKFSPEAADIVMSFLQRATGWRKRAREGRYDMVIRGVAYWFASYEERDETKTLITKVGEVICKVSGSLVERANALTLPFSDQQEMPDGVQLSTMHSSKGLEFNNVWIVGCDAATIPSPKSDNYEEERRLMYVAMTRAKNNLYLSSIVGSEPSPFVIDAGCDPRSSSGEG